MEVEGRKESVWKERVWRDRAWKERAWKERPWKVCREVGRATTRLWRLRTLNHCEMALISN